MKVTKKAIKLLGLVVVIVFLFDINLFDKEKEFVNNEIIHISNEQLDYNEYMNFENIVEEINDNKYRLNLDSRIHVNSLMSYDMVSYELENEIVINYDVNLDIDTEIIEIELSTIDGFGAIQKDYLKGFLQIDGSLMMIDQDGESIFITSDGFFEQCGWFKNLCNKVKNIVKAIKSEAEVLVEAVVNSVSETLVAIGNRAISTLFDTSAFLTDLAYADKSIVEEHYSYNSKLTIDSNAWYNSFLNK